MRLILSELTFVCPFGQVMEAEKVAETSRIYQEQKLAEKDSIRHQEHIENEIYLAKQKSLVDAEVYR